MTSNAHDTTWTDERVETLKTLWNEGKSAGQVAVLLTGVTRNAVIGKVNRLGLKRDAATLKATRQLSGLGKVKKPKSQRPKVTGARNTGGASKARAISKGLAKSQDALPPVKAMADVSFARPWIERKFGECAFPIGTGGDLLSCCAPTERTYCRACEAVMYRPEQPTRKSTMRIARLAA